MFERFLAFFNLGLECEISSGEEDIYENFMDSFGGMQFGNGLFNVFYKEEIEKWSEIVKNAYPELEREVQIFGYDWLGRVFGIDSNEEEKILMFEIGTAEILEIPCNFLDFINEEIPLYNEACFATSFYSKWLRKKKKPVVYGRCIGYKIPLFAGGKDVIKNLEDSDLEVYWHVVSEVKKRLN